MYSFHAASTSTSLPFPPGTSRNGPTSINLSAVVSSASRAGGAATHAPSKLLQPGPPLMKMRSLNGQCARSVWRYAPGLVRDVTVLDKVEVQVLVGGGVDDAIKRGRGGDQAAVHGQARGGLPREAGDEELGGRHGCS